MNMKSIIGFDAQPKWFTCSPTTWATLFTDVVILRHCIRTKEHHLLANKWLSGLFNISNTLVRRKGTIPWYFPVGHVVNACAVCWEAKEDRYEDDVWFSPSLSNTSVRVFVCLDESSWEAMRVEWMTPGEQYASTRIRPASHFPELRAVRRSDETVPLLTVVAEQLDLEIPPNSSKFALLSLLLKEILKCDNYRLADILSQLAYDADTGVADLFGIPEVEDHRRRRLRFDGVHKSDLGGFTIAIVFDHALGCLFSIRDRAKEFLSFSFWASMVSMCGVARGVRCT